MKEAADAHISISFRTFASVFSDEMFRAVSKYENHRLCSTFDCRFRFLIACSYDSFSANFDAMSSVCELMRRLRSHHL